MSIDLSKIQADILTVAKEAGEADPVANKQPSPEAYYDQSRKEYLIADLRGGWVPLNETSLKRIYKMRGMNPRPDRGELISEIDSQIVDVQTRLNVSYAGPIAGYMPGLHETTDARVLVTVGPNMIPAIQGDWSMLHDILLGMLGDKQLPYLIGWLKVARSSMFVEPRTPGQALAIAGPKDSGKSLFQNLITLALGGRSARPYQFMAGQTPFNAHLFGAEHLMIEDESPLTDHKARRALGAMVKSMTSNVGQQCHRKGSTPITLNPFWRLSITLNDEPENLMVLPPIDEPLEDKLILLKAEHRPMPLPTARPDDRFAFWEKLKGELPGFLAYVESWEIPEELVSQRFGITHFHHPELLAKLDDLAPESKLLSIIENHLLATSSSWQGKASDLERVITDRECPYSYEARNLLSWPTACGTYLGRLRRRYPYRFSVGLSGEDRVSTWTVKSAR